MSVVELPVRNLSLRRKDIRARLWNPPNGIQSSEIDIIPPERADHRRREAEHKRQEQVRERNKKLEEFETRRLWLARKTRALELTAEFHAAVSAWVAEAGNEPVAPALPRLTCTQIINATADYFELSQLDLISARRAGVVLYPRMVAMYIARKHTACSFPMIGQRFGGRDHTTVHHAVRNAERKLAEGDTRFAEDLAAIKQRLGIE